MSIASASRQGFAAEARATTEGFETEATQPNVDSALERIVQWIPTEAVGAYIAILGVFPPGGTNVDKERWAIFAIGVALVVAFTFLNAALVNKRGAEEWKKQGKAGSPPSLSGGRFVKVLLLTLFAFVVWVGALPGGSPFIDLWSDATKAFGVAVIPISAALPQIAELLGVTVPKE